MLYTTPVLATAPSSTLNLEPVTVPHVIVTHATAPRGSIFLGKNRETLPKNLSDIEFVAPSTNPGLEDTTIDGRDVFTRGISRSPTVPEIVDTITPTHVKVERMLAA